MIFAHVQWSIVKSRSFLTEEMMKMAAGLSDDNAKVSNNLGVSQTVVFLVLLPCGRVIFLFLLLSLSLLFPEVAAEATATEPDILSIPVTTRLTSSSTKFISSSYGHEAHLVLGGGR